MSRNGVWVLDAAVVAGKLIQASTVKFSRMAPCVRAWGAVAAWRPSSFHAGAPKKALAAVSVGWVQVSGAMPPRSGVVCVALVVACHWLQIVADAVDAMAGVAAYAAGMVVAEITLADRSMKRERRMGECRGGESRQKTWAASERDINQLAISNGQVGSGKDWGLNSAC